MTIDLISFNFFGTSIEGARGKLIEFKPSTGKIKLTNYKGDFESIGVTSESLSAHMCDSSMNRHITKYLIERGLPVYQKGHLIRKEDRIGKLIDRLVKIEQNEIQFTSNKTIEDKDYGTVNLIDDDVAKNLALSVFCNDIPNVYARLELLKHGFNVFPIHQNGSKWLVGGIKTNKGIISFG